MKRKSIHTYVRWIAVFAPLVLFCYFRAKPIYFQTVPYTYDQGRDFLKAEEIIRYKNPTFIGPTTGIQGLHHGAWWYYFLSFIFVLFNGWPEGFYYGMLAFAAVTSFLFYRFLRREFGFIPAILFLLFVTTSPYFIRIAFFPGNNILTPGAILLYLYASYRVLKKPDKWGLFLSGLSVGFITETEVSFGLFLIPGYVILSVLFDEFRSAWKDKEKLVYQFAGFVLPFIPRLLFNIKNGFIEISSTLSFLQVTPPTNPQSFMGAVGDRGDLFVRYFQSMIFENNPSLTIAIAVFIVSAVVIGARYATQLHLRMFVFTMLSICFIFLASLANKDNFFWDNYLEGIQYFYVFLFILAVAIVSKTPGMPPVGGIFVIGFAVMAVTMLLGDVTAKTQPEYVGLRADVGTVEYVYDNVGKDDFCVQIYTPPTVPYTYTYLFSYYSKVKGYKWPHEGYYNNQCWYIIDKDDYEERVDMWRKEHIPEGAEQLQMKTMPNGAQVELWQTSDQ